MKNEKNKHLGLLGSTIFSGSKKSEPDGQICPEHEGGRSSSARMATQISNGNPLAIAEYSKIRKMSGSNKKIPAFTLLESILGEILMMLLKNALKASITAGFILGTIGTPSEVFATQRSKVRQEARDTRQTGRDDSRQAKQECRENDEQSNAKCRREKRGSKQETREEARDTKY